MPLLKLPGWTFMSPLSHILRLSLSLSLSLSLLSLSLSLSLFSLSLCLSLLQAWREASQAPAGTGAVSDAHERVSVTRLLRRYLFCWYAVLLSTTASAEVRRAPPCRFLCVETAPLESPRMNGCPESIGSRGRPSATGRGPEPHSSCGQRPSGAFVCCGHCLAGGRDAKRSKVEPLRGAHGSCEDFAWLCAEALARCLAHRLACRQSAQLQEAAGKMAQRRRFAAMWAPFQVPCRFASLLHCSASPSEDRNAQICCGSGVFM